MQAHVRSRVVMDIAAFKISHSVGIDKDATALRAVRARSSSIGAMDEMFRQGHRRRAHIPCTVRIHVGVNQRCCAAMDVESSTLQAKRPSA